MSIIIQLAALLSSIAAQSESSLMPFVLSLTSFRSMPRPDGNPSTVVQQISTPDDILKGAKYDFWGNFPKSEKEIQAGNCCVRDASRQQAMCGQPGVCCSVCQVSGTIIGESPDSRFHFITSLNQLSSQQTPSGQPSEQAKLIVAVDMRGVSLWNNFDFYGTPSLNDSSVSAGTCCVRSAESQIAACGQAGACCGSCQESSISLSQISSTGISNSYGSASSPVSNTVYVSSIPYTPAAAPVSNNPSDIQQPANLCKSDLNEGVCNNKMTSQHCTANMQDDGNLVVYSNGFPVWNSNTSGQGKGPYTLKMQSDENLVQYDSTSHSLWSSGTTGKGTGPYSVVMQDDCNFVVYDSNHNVNWESGTAGK